jgi:hypothetical protein
MTDCKRYGKKWTIPEVLNLQREHELLKLSVEEIASRHQRSVDSILFKIDAEGLMPCIGYSNVYKIPTLTKIDDAKAKELLLEKEFDEILSYTDSSSNDDNLSEYNSDDEICVDCNINTLSDRVWSLETSVEEINTMVKQMFDQMTAQKKIKKRAPLRKGGAKINTL